MPCIISSGYICIDTPKKTIVNWWLSFYACFNLIEQENVDFLELSDNNSKSKDDNRSNGSFISVSGFFAISGN